MGQALRNLTMAVALCACAIPAWAEGEEEFGNKPLNEANFKDWPGIMPVVNHTTRVYRTWVNGNEHFYYKGDAAALNDVLAKYAAAGSPVKEVVIRPGPGETGTFDQTKKVQFNWQLHLVGGIAKHLTTRDKAEGVWRPNPVLSIFVDRETDVKAIRIPKVLAVLTLPALKNRTREGFRSTDKTVRGWTCGVLASLDPYDTDSRNAISDMLKDPDDWVRLNAAGAIALFGAKARQAIPLLRAALNSGTPGLSERAKETIQEIEKAEERTDAEKEHRRIDEQIQKRFTIRR